MSSVSPLLAGFLPLKQTAIIEYGNGNPIIIRDAPVPTLRYDTILVSTKAVALNPSDYRMGAAFPSPGALVGMDFAGHIIAIHPAVRKRRPDLQLDDAVRGIVHGSNPGDYESGCFAEYVIALPDLVLKIPSNLPLEHAATLGCALLTNCIAFWSALKIEPTPQTPSESLSPVLVYGGSTSCGLLAGQLLKL